jgi:hypothetical protein
LIDAFSWGRGDGWVFQKLAGLDIWDNRSSNF